MPRAIKRTTQEFNQPLVKISFSARLARPWLSGTGESMWVLKVAGSEMKGAGLLANQPFLLRYARLGDVVLYASGHRNQKPEALVVERPKFECDLAAMTAGEQPAWATAAERARTQCKQLFKRLPSGDFKTSLAKIDAHQQKILGCAICGLRDAWWMTTNDKWARVPKRYRNRVLCRNCFTKLTRIKP